jgi:hypothetical protein
VSVWLPGADRLLAEHASELPQKDELCGAFCATLAVRAAGLRADGTPVDQDAIGRLAGTILSTGSHAESLPPAEEGRRDYRLGFPTTDDEAISGTSATGVLRALEAIGDGALAVVPVAGPWEGGVLRRVLEAAGACRGPVACLANPATRFLWGSRASAAALVGHLLHGDGDGPPPDWDVGHFVLLLGAVDGPGGTLVAVADTYRSLGHGGVHLQPLPAVEEALEGGDKGRRGVLLVLPPDQAEALRGEVAALGLDIAAWDNGTPDAGAG